MTMTERKEQIETCPASVYRIMSSSAFAQGVSDIRNGRPARFDEFDDDDLWAYERGRQWASIAPKSMPVRIGRKLNLEAVKLFGLAGEDIR
jgi:hypothetical protein